jgi:deoxyribodipyrimidine photolyase-related protein
MRNLILVLGDQLNSDSVAFDGFDRELDAVWMVEVTGEATHVWSHKARIALFLSAMRHFQAALKKRRITVHYRQLDDRDNRGDFAGELEAAVKKCRPRRLILVEPGEWRVRELFRATAAEMGIELTMREDRHFLCSHDEFAIHAEGRLQLRLEYFYREMRRTHNVLMKASKPIGGKWNYDSANRGSFTRSGPGVLPPPKRFRQDAVSKEVIRLVELHFPNHPGRLDHFDWPVTSHQAKQALDDFIQHRLVRFGDYQDAMWTDEPYLYHSRISAAMNLKLLDPRDVIRSAEAAYHAGIAPLNAVEGFIRQILGWREFVRGVYWLHMPEYLERNALKATAPLPGIYWTGETDMNCLRHAIQQTLDYGYAHHIQRLMVTGLFALLLGVDPKALHEWYLAVYVDAVEWVELPNSLGMSQFADGGVMASKPYAATGKYIQRMSNYCDGCRFDPAKATGENACPFTTLYWDFLQRHEQLLASNQRMSLQVKNLQRKSGSELSSIREQAARLRESIARGLPQAGH